MSDLYSWCTYLIIYCDVIIRFLCSGCHSGMLFYVQMICEFLWLSLICFSFWRAACDACPSVIESSEVLQETQHFFRPSLGYWGYRFKASTFDHFGLGNGHCEGRGAKSRQPLVTECIDLEDFSWDFDDRKLPGYLWNCWESNWCHCNAGWMLINNRLSLAATFVENSSGLC